MAASGRVSRALSLTVLPERLAICRLAPYATIPPWAAIGAFTSVTRTAGELSVVCADEHVPAEVVAARGWVALRVDGSVGLSAVGILAAAVTPLAEAGISVFTIATYDTDYLLVKQEQLDAAAAALSAHDHDVRYQRPEVVIRAVGQEDEFFLWAMLAEAAHEPEARTVKGNPDLARYVRGWGRAGDLGVLAETAENGEPLGASWLRLWAGADRGYGYIDDQTPELSIAVRPQWRGMGIGTRLLVALLRTARTAHPAISLSVRTDNPALRLYERMGFRTVEASDAANRVGGTSVTMKADLLR